MRHDRPRTQPTRTRPTRIPPARMTGPVGWLLAAYTRRTWGQVPLTLPILWHHRRVLTAILGLERRVARWHRLDRRLRSFAEIGSAAVIGCSWCLDFGSFLAHRDGIDAATLRDVPRWRGSSRFTPLERDVLAYAEAASATPSAVPDELAERLLSALGAPAMVELAQIVALENMRSRFNAAVGLESQGFSAVCEVPPVVPSSS